MSERISAITRPWTWISGTDRTPGVGIFGGTRNRRILAHLTPEEARTMADQLHDIADQLDQQNEQE